MQKSLNELLDMVLRDVRNSAGPQPLVEDLAWSRESGQMTAFLRNADGTGAGVQVMEGEPEAQQLAELADQVQEWFIEARWAQGLSTSWPDCPHHPGSHPLSAVAREGRAVWTCPVDHSAIADVGGLRSRAN